MKNNLNTNNPLLLIAGLFLSGMFIMNVAFGNAFMNITTLGLPLNQLLIAFLLIILSSFGLIKIPTGFPIFLYIWLLFSLFIWLPIGLLNYGIVAGRDATQVLDATVLFLAFSIFSRMSSFSIAKACEKILLLALTLELLDRIVLFQFHNVTISSFQEVKFFGGTIGSSIIIVSAFWFGIVMKENITKTNARYLIYISLLLILLHQNRFIYVSMITTAIIYLHIIGASFLNKAFLKKIALIIVLLLCFEIFIVLTKGQLISLLPELEYLNSHRLFKFGMESLSLFGIIEHLGTGFGIENELYSGAAGGVFQRLGWWYPLLSTMFSDVRTLFFGIGYGVPLTPDVAITIIREPHNSYISVFCRNGLILFIVWFIFHLTVAFKSIVVLKKDSAHSVEYKLLLISLLITVSTYVTALVEPAFELSPIAISTYIFIALSLVTLSRLKGIRMNGISR